LPILLRCSYGSMKKNLIAFLFGESQVDDEIAGIVESIADLDTDGSSDLKVEKQPLVKALSSIGIEAKNLENDPRGLSLVFGDGEEYRAAHAILNEPDSLHKLAELGWVYSTQGDVAMANEPAEFRIRFLEIDEIEPANTKATYSDSDKARLNKVKEIIKKGREFATEEPDFDDSECNPVDHSDPKKGKRDKGVSQAKDGADPEGKPKGSDGGASNPSLSEPGKGDLTQPKEGTTPKRVKEGIDWAARVRKMRQRRGDSVEEAAFAAGSEGRPGRYAGGGHEFEVPPSQHHRLDLSAAGNAIRSTHPDTQDVDIGLLDDLSTRKFGVAYNMLQGDQKAQVNNDARATSARYSSRPTGSISQFGEAGHKSGCQCGFCKNKGNIGNYKKGKKADKPEADGDGDVEESNAAEIVNSMLEGNPGTPPGILGHKSFSTMKVPGGSKDRKFSPAKGMVQAAPEGSIVAKQTKPNRSA